MRESPTGLWQTVGGMVDPDETPSDAVLREAEEETGLTVRLNRHLLRDTGLLNGPAG